ncbi:hypothetical protein [Streptomyces sp. NRRL S-1022]|uniref:hypothetical protein n=1 Tax=Streptomyces sp. NRRL S-1022 TaxID=1463880 RepID=UPI00131B742B|nr:hypothetical protein [Streptomyces sp. NRRL S-1022]
MAVRGRKQPHRHGTGHLPPNETVRASVVLKPGDYVRGLYEELVRDMGVSGAEVLREALMELHKRESRRKAREAAKNAAANPQELPKAG